MQKQLQRKKGGLARMAGGGQPSKVLGGNIMAGASWNSLNNLLVNDLTQATGQPTTNTAVGGATTADTYQQLMDFINDGGSFDPNATVFLQTGGVDFLKGVPKDEIKGNIDKILSTLEAQGVSVVLTGSPYASSMEDVVSNNFDPKIDPLFQEVASKYNNVALVDSMGDILQDKSLLSDNLHPNETGTRRYNDDVLGALNQLKQRQEPQTQGGREASVNIPQEIERITQASVPEERDVQDNKVQETLDIPQEIERITQKNEPSNVLQNTQVSQIADPIKQEFQEAITQPAPPPVNLQTTPEVPSTPDYSRAYGALGGAESVSNLRNQFLGMGLDEGAIGEVFSKYYSPESDATLLAKKGGAIRMQVGGLTGLANLGKAGTRLSKAEIAGLRARGMGVPGIDFADPLKAPTMRMSEALGNVGAEGKTLNFTEADRSRVFAENMGGIGFTGLQNYSQPHKQARTVWGFGNQSTAEKKIAQNDPEKTIWTTYAGSPEQHKSNTVVVKDAVKTLQAANQAGTVNPEQIKLINQRIKQAKNDKGNPLFSDDFDITDPQAINAATTFERRTAISDALMGVGVRKPMISKEFKAANPNVKYNDASNISRILTRETDPVLANANTFDVGPHLFVMDNKIINRADLNEAFPVQVTGDDLGMRFKPTPVRSAAPEFMKKKGYGPTDPVNAWAMSRGNPKQFVSEEYLTNLQKEGYKDGGSAERPPFHDFDKIMNRKDGGTVNTSFEQRLKSALDQHMAVGGVVERRYAEAGSVPAPTPQELEKMADAQGAAFGVFPQMASQRFQQPSQTMDKASEMLKAQVTKEWEQAGRPGGAKGLSLRIGAVLAGQVPDIANLAQSVIPGLNKPASVLDPEGEKVAKFPMSGTSTDIKNAMRNKGMINEDEYPIAEMLGAFAAPYAAVKAPRAIEGGLNSVTAAARRPFTPATLTTEAVAPDLAKFKPREFQDEVTRQMIGEGAAVPMTNMGGRKTTQRGGQGVYMNNEGQLELNPMVGVDVPRAGNLSTNKSLRRDIATAGQELNQEAMAAHRFVPMATNNIKDATAMMVTGPNGRALSNEEVIALGKNIPGLIVSHSPRTGGVFLANDPYAGGDPMKKFLNAQSVAGQILGNKAKIQFGKADANKDLMYMMRHQYAEEGGRGTSPTAQAIRESLKRKDQTIPTVRN